MGSNPIVSAMIKAGFQAEPGLYHGGDEAETEGVRRSQSHHRPHRRLPVVNVL